MQNNYVDAKPDLFSKINIVPLIGVLAALLAIMMLAFPGYAMQHNASYSWGGCGGPLDGPHRHVLNIQLDGSGNIKLDELAVSREEIIDIILSAPKQANHRIIAEVDIDDDASYQDVMSLVAALHQSNLEQGNIKLINRRY